MRILLALFVVAAAWAECLPVQGERILAAQLAAAIPAFAAAGDRAIAPAPLAGSERRMSRAELERVARRLGLAESAIRPETWPDALCFAYPQAPLDEERIRTALAQPGAPAGLDGVEIADYSKFPVPAGPIVLHPLSAASVQRDGTQIIRGAVVYAPGRRQPIWIRVRAHQDTQVLVAAHSLSPGTVIDAGAVRTEPGGARAGQGVTALSEIEGMSVRRTIPAGARLTRAMFTRPRDIDPGQVVRVNVQSGRARLAFEARAESGGFAGDQILVRSPLSEQKLRVRVAGKGRAGLDISLPEAENH